MKSRVASLTALTALSSFAAAQTGVNSPLASRCGPSNPTNIVCINKYDAVLPYHFSRQASSGSTEVVFGETNISSTYAANDSSFNSVSSTPFLVFDPRGLAVLGSNPTYDYVFPVSSAVHEAPVYIPSKNWLLLSQLAPPPGYLPQLLIDLNKNPPTLQEYLSDPPVYAPNGGTFHNGLVYWAASGGNNSIGGGEQRAGIRTLDPQTNKTMTLLNNYFGYYFNTIDDLFVDSKGDVWFTDPYYSWFNHLTDTAPQLPSASYRFRPSTGAVQLVSDDLDEPNGIAISPDEKTIYISDTGAVAGTYTPAFPANGTPFNQTGKRAIYKYDVVDNGMNICCKRPIYLAQDWVPDGLKVAANGMVVTGAGKGVDIMDEYGTLVLRIQTNYTVQNFAWVGEDLKEFWLMGNGGISRVRWQLRGQNLAGTTV